jgi:hypothetical protein
MNWSKTHLAIKVQIAHMPSEVLIDIKLIEYITRMIEQFIHAS